MICEAANASFIWEQIEEKKVLMDRVRYLSLSFGAQVSLDEHKEILEAIQSSNSALAVDKIRQHLSHIKVDMSLLSQEHSGYFID